MKNIKKYFYFLIGTLVVIGFNFSLLEKIADKFVIFIGGTHIHEEVRITDKKPLEATSSDRDISVPEEKKPVFSSDSKLELGQTEIVSHDAKIQDNTQSRDLTVIHEDDIADIQEEKKPAVPTPQPRKQTQSKETPQTVILGTQADNVTYTGYLNTRNDKKTYKFTLDCSCEVNITFSSSGRDNASYKLTVLDVSGNVLTQKMIDIETLSANTGNLYLRAGAYTIRVERGYSWSGKPYALAVNVSQAVNTEEESNDNIHTANDIPLNEDVRASSNTRNDVDYFRFTLDRASYVCPHLEFEPVNSSKGEIYSLKLYELTILNAGKRPFVFRGDGKSSKAIKPFILDAGQYIIIISRVEDARTLELGLHEYTLRIDAKGIM